MYNPSDQTATVSKVNLHDKRVCIIGSHATLDDLHLTDTQLAQFDVVIRLNKFYAACGKRCEIIFTRWISWVDDKYKIRNFFPQSLIDNAQDIIITNQSLGISETEKQLICEEAGVLHASIGLLAVGYCLHRGVRDITLIGFGDGKTKKYCSNSGYGRGYKDTNTFYNWKKERNFYENQPKIKFYER